MKKIVLLFFGFCLLVWMVSCDEMNSRWSGSSGNERYDSLFLGISLGMDKEKFYDHCWEMNRQKVFTHSPTNQAVEFVMVSELDKPVMMRFYPLFYQEKIVEMPVTFSYEAWAPWNKQYQSDVLLLKMLSVFKKWYGEDFKVIDHPRMGKVYVKMDGRRRINLFIRDDQFVQAVFSDLRMVKERDAEERREAKKQENE